MGEKENETNKMTTENILADGEVQNRLKSLVLLQDILYSFQQTEANLCFLSSYPS
uniref:Uncharacterized protein n=1 Tax=Arion vulgaris TaxID=1028688 RepID=A0A0B7ABJ4_9EUPU